MEYFYIFLAEMALNCFILVFGLCLWKIIWLDNFPTIFPKQADKYKGQLDKDPEPDTTANSFIEVFKLIIPILIEFNPEYWINSCGFDAYSYLYF